MAENKNSGPKPRILVVGGGAAGLELATKLGNTLGKKKKADIILIDVSQTHLWKPLLHEVAAGTLDVNDDQLDYLAHASANHFRFVWGRMDGLDRVARRVSLAPVYNAAGEELIPSCAHPYDLLVLAVGSVCNDFGVPGVVKHCLFLDTAEEAQQFHRRLLEAYMRAHALGGVREPGQLDVAIVGGGATGIELSAQLHQATRLLASYGLDNVRPSDIRIHLIEASPRLLPGLPTRLSDSTVKQLTELGIELHLGQRVVEVRADGVQTAKGLFIPAFLKVWAAGVKAPDFLGRTDLETNHFHQVVVRQTLQTTRDDRIFAIGDCAACPWPGHEGTVPPRAQAAHQQANLACENLRRYLEGKPLLNYRYRDYGSLVSFGKYSTVGNLMGNLLGNVMIEGVLARLVYLSLYRMHQMALFGPFRVALILVVQFFSRRLRPKIKLH